MPPPLAELKVLSLEGGEVHKDRVDLWEPDYRLQMMPTLPGRAIKGDAAFLALVRLHSVPDGQK